MINWLQLIRIPNLIIVGSTQYLLQYKLILPKLHANGLLPALSDFQFALLSLMTILATAAGYVINDWYDYPIDKINRPEKVIVNKLISFQKVKYFYFALLIIGAWIASFLGAQTGDWGIPLLYFIVSLSLFIYASTLKKSFLLGNILVAILCALVAGLVWYTEWNSISKLNNIDSTKSQFIHYVFFAYLTFAFLITLFREIVKDIEDIKGDRRVGADTLPIVAGIKNAKLVIAVVGVLLMASMPLWFFFYRSSGDLLSAGLLLFFLFVPLLISLFLLKRAKISTDFRQISSLAKAIMLMGLFYLYLIN